MGVLLTLTNIITAIITDTHIGGMTALMSEYHYSNYIMEKH